MLRQGPKIRQASRRRSGGVVMAEFVSAAVMLALVTLVAANLGLTLFAAWVNDEACRDAARAAGQQGTANAALTAAQVAVKPFASGCVWFTSPTVLTTGNYFQYQTYPDSTGQVQRDQGPYVRVTTSVNVKLPAPIIYANAKMTDQLQLIQAYSFPIVNPQPVGP